MMKKLLKTMPGKKIIDEEHYTSIYNLDVSNLQNGLYIATITTGENQIKTLKFIVSK